MTKRLETGITVIMGLALVLSLPLISPATKATPIGPTNMTIISTSRADENRPAAQIEALAGNVTELLIHSEVVTKTWAGYYGNVTGRIVLDDANNNSMYTWDINELVGEVYASRGEVDFSSSNIICANSTHVIQEEANLSVSSTAADGVNETFIYNTHPSFYVGSKLFSANDCGYTASTYVNDAADSSRTFNETLLFDKIHNRTVYASLLTNNQDGFKVGSDYYDFQMLVGEDGHGNTDTTLYYFYVELE